MKNKKIFTLSDLDEKFWEKLLLIERNFASGLGDMSGLTMYTSDGKMYSLVFEGFPYSEKNLEEFSPIFKKNENVEEREHPYAVDGKGWKFFSRCSRAHEIVFLEHYLVRDDFYDSFISVYDEVKDEVAPNISRLVGLALGIERELEVFVFDETVKIFLKHQKEYEKREKERKRKQLTSNHFVWKEIHPNNINSNYVEGLYALIFKESEGEIQGYKFSIVYQREIDGYFDGRVEMYNLFEKKYRAVHGPLYYLNYEDNKSTNTLNNDDMNSYGCFIRSFLTLGEAKEYVLKMNELNNYADIETIITDIETR